MNHLRRRAWAGAASLLLAAAMGFTASAQKPDKDAKDNPDSRKPQLKLKAQPVIAMAPARIVLTAELVGGANDFEDFYCPTIEWEWGDGTRSESSADCTPYEPGKSEIRRRFTVEHVFKRPDNYRVYFHLSHATEQGDEESTSGWLSIRQDTLVLALSEVHDRHGPQPDISKYDRQMPNVPERSSAFDVIFEPEEYLIKVNSGGKLFAPDQREELYIKYREALSALPRFPGLEPRLTNTP